MCFFYPVRHSDPSPGLTFSKPGIQTVFPASPEQDSVPHATSTHPLTIRALQATKLGFLSLPLSFPPTELVFLSVSPHWFSLECSHGSPFCSHRGSPPPTDPRTGIRKESQPILNSVPTHTSSTFSTLSTFPILQELASSSPSLHRFYMPISWQ